MSSTAVDVHSRERLAWAFVMTSFLGLCALLVAIPIGINSFIQRATESLEIVLEANQGTVSLNDNQGVQRAILPGDPPVIFRARANVRTGFPANAFILISPPETATPLARLQMLPNATMLLEKATTPRFAASHNEYELQMRLQNGRFQFKVFPDAIRPFLITLATPHGTIEIVQAGDYIIDVSLAESQIMVQAGEARLMTMEQTMTLLPDQRAEFYAEAPPVGPLIPQENLIANGHFRQPILQGSWQKAEWNIELPDQPTGMVRQIETADQGSLRLTRDGVGHADIHFSQELDVPVPEADEGTSLWLQIRFRIISQSLEVCGFQGSECPLFAQLAYEDEEGQLYNWQQGFYTLAGSNENSPPTCSSCFVVQSGHEQVATNEVTVYEINMAEIGRLGPTPRRLTQVSLVASGHSFDVEILDVALFMTQIDSSQ